MGKVATLRELRSAEAEAERASRRLPADWKAGLGDYLGRVEGELTLTLLRASTFDADAISSRIAALRSVKTLVSDSTLDLAPAQSLGELATGDRRVELARIVTPRGWRDTLGRLLGAALDAALERGLEAAPGEARKLAFAMARELDGLLMWLSEIEKAADEARAEAQRRAYAPRRS